MSVAAVIVAGGMGRRFGNAIPKAFVPLRGKELFLYSLELFDAMNCFESIVVVVPQDACRATKEICAQRSLSTPIHIVAGGAERWQSVQQGVHKAGNVDQVLIHDAARPFVTKEIVLDLLNRSENIPGIITATPVVDTVRYFKEEHCGETIDRSQLIAVGTPQVFDRTVLLECFSAGEQMDQLPTDEAMLLQKCGYPVTFVWGNRLNFKLTTPEDMNLAEAIILLQNTKSLHNE